MRVETHPKPISDVVLRRAQLLRNAWLEDDYAEVYAHTPSPETSFEEEQLEVLDSIASCMRRLRRRTSPSQSAAILSVLSHLGARP